MNVVGDDAQGAPVGVAHRRFAVCGSRFAGSTIEFRQLAPANPRTTRIPCMAKLKSEVEVQCPCCSALLVIDINLGRVVSHKAPERGDKPELTEASRILAEEERRREALFEQSVAGREDAR